VYICLTRPTTSIQTLRSGTSIPALRSNHFGQHFDPSSIKRFDPLRSTLIQTLRSRNFDPSTSINQHFNSALRSKHFDPSTSIQHFDPTVRSKHLFDPGTSIQPLRSKHFDPKHFDPSSSIQALPIHFDPSSIKHFDPALQSSADPSTSIGTSIFDPTSIQIQHF
jgi:hypothetical protein